MGDRIEKNKQYGKCLEAHCKKNDCKFKEYNTKSLKWIFTVEHFTIYGLPGAKPSILKKQPQKKKNVNVPLSQFEFGGIESEGKKKEVKMAKFEFKNAAFQSK